jgi:phage repressor protein C with HTH and peptisase S24 domain
MWRDSSTGASQFLLERPVLADDEREGLTARLQQAVRDAGGTRAVALLSGVPERSLTRYLAGASEPSALTLAKVARAINVGLDWLVTGSGPARSDDAEGAADGDTVLLPLMNVMAEAGNGIENHDVAVLDHLPFSRQMLRGLGVSIEHAHVIQHTGDSMAPTLADGGICVIDTSKTRPRGGGIFALIVGNELLIKRLALSPRGLTVISDNADKYPAETLTDDELGRVRVIGKVFWTGGEV